MEKRRVTIDVRGLACGGGGVTSIERSVGRLAGIHAVYVNPATSKAYVEFDPERCDIESIARAIRRLGFEPGRPVFDRAP